jgi:hypothetical protein
MLRFGFLIAFSTATVVGLAACPGPGDSCQPYKSGANLTAPATSLRNDVMPIFQPSCALLSCHSTLTAAGLLILQGDAGTVRGNVVGVASNEVSSMVFVKAGDPGQSYLMHKADGDSCSLTGCGVDGGLCTMTMPLGGQLLPTDARDVIRRWIAQGALDN